MANSWQLARFGDLLNSVSRAVTIEPDKLYRVLGMRWYAQGLFLKEEKLGQEIRAKEVYHVELDDFVYNRLFAWKGSFGIVDKQTAGGFVSGEFPCFRVDAARADAKFLLLYLSQERIWDEIGRNSSGQTNISRLRLKEPDFLRMEIPLPSLAEQQRIVARVDALARRVEEARGLRRAAEEEAEAVTARATSAMLDDAGWQIQRLESVLAEPPRNGLSPQSKAERIGRKMLRINAVSSSPTRFLDLSAFKFVEVADEVARPFEIQNDDVFIVRYNGDLNRVAKAAIFKSNHKSDVIYPDKLIRLRADKAKIAPDFLAISLGARSVRSQIEEMGKTTAGQIGVSGSDAKSFQIPVPPLPDQRRIVAYLDGLQAKVEELRRLQAETQKELDALMPSILAKAFAGELL